MNLGKVVNLFMSLQQVATVKMPIKGAYAVSKNIGLLETDYKFFEDERKKLQDEYFAKDDKGDMVAIPEKEKELNEKFDGLQGIEVDITLYKVSLDLFGNIDLTPAQMYAISGIIKEEVPAT